jgi:hypothetical protein
MFSLAVDNNEKIKTNCTVKTWYLPEEHCA